MESLLGPAISALSKCFVGYDGPGQIVEGRTQVGPSKDWSLSVILRMRPVGGDDGVS